MSKQKLKLNIPGSLSSITLGEYQEFLNDVEEYRGNEIELNKSLISIFCNVPRKTVELFSGSQITEVTTMLYGILNKKDHKLIRISNIEDIEFGFIPDLEEATFGEWTDIDSYLGDHNQWHRLAAVLFRPTTVKRFDKKLQEYRYDIVPYVNTKQYAEAMRLLPLDVFLGAYTFFSNIGIELLKTIPSYLETQIASKEVQQLLQDLQENGDGLGFTTASLKETLEDYKRLAMLITEKHSTG